MNQAKMPRTVADAARMMRIQRLSCISGHWYRRRVSRYTISVAMSRGCGEQKDVSVERTRYGRVQRTVRLRKLQKFHRACASSRLGRRKCIYRFGVGKGR